MPSTSILITGVAGFIGSNLATRLLDEGYSVIGIDNLSAGMRENVDPRVDFHLRDIREPDLADLLKGVDTVFHLAAKNCLYDCLQNCVETSDINVRGTVNILEHARQAGVRKFIYADSSAEYEGVTEFPSRVDRIDPIGAYAVSKRGGALFCETYQRLLGMKITVLRYFNVYGPAQDWRRVIPPVMSAFIIKVLQGERPVVYGTGEKKRDYVYVDDVNDFHLLVMRDDRTTGQVYNVGSGVNYSVLDIYEMIERRLKTGLRPIFKEDLPGEAQVTLADISRERTLGWNPKTSINEGLDRLMDYIRQRVLPHMQLSGRST